MTEPAITPAAQGLVQLTVDVGRHPDAVAALAARDIILAGPGRVAGDGAASVWTGPRDWLILCDRAIADDVADTCRVALAEVPSLVNNVSAGHVAFEVSGNGAVALLATGTGIDLDPSVFGPGATAVTRFAELRAVLVHRHDHPGSYLILADRSRGRHLAIWLADQAI